MYFGYFEIFQHFGQLTEKLPWIDFGGLFLLIDNMVCNIGGRNSKMHFINGISILTLLVLRTQADSIKPQNQMIMINTSKMGQALPFAIYYIYAL